MDFSRATVLCLGDVILDRFVYCGGNRISPEAPGSLRFKRPLQEAPVARVMRSNHTFSEEAVDVTHKVEVWVGMQLIARASIRTGPMANAMPTLRRNVASSIADKAELGLAGTVGVEA